jgi:diacylglycerol diphosphate phosphatase / phosphatidate phosphatase
MILTPTLTDIVKNAVGRPRPDMLARCKPALGTPRDIIVDIGVCTEANQRLLQDGWRAFPSGHSSWSFAGLGYLALYMAGQFRVFALGRQQEEIHGHRRGLAGMVSGNGNSGTGESSNASETLSGVGVGTPPTHAEKVIRGDLALSLACFAPLVGAVMIAISRVQDYRHDVYDVCVGGLLGSIVAYWSYRRYWPRLSSARCDEPYEGPPPPVLSSVNSQSGRYDRIRDEEEGDVDVSLHSVGA